MPGITEKVQALIDRFNILKNSREFWEEGDEYWAGWPGDSHDSLRQIEEDAKIELASWEELEPQTENSKINRDALETLLDGMERFKEGILSFDIRRWVTGRELVEIGGLPLFELAKTMRETPYPSMGAWRPGTGKNVVALEQCKRKRIGFSEGQTVTEKDIDRMEARVRQEPDFQLLSEEEQDQRLVEALNELVDQKENIGIHEAEERERRIDDFYQAHGLGTREDRRGGFLKWLTAEKKPEVPFGCDAISFVIPDKEPAYSDWYEEVMGLIFDLGMVLHYLPEEHHPKGQIRHIPCMHKEQAWTAFGMDGRRREENKALSLGSSSEDRVATHPLPIDNSRNDEMLSVKQFIIKLRNQGLDDKAITKQIDENFPGISDANLGELLPVDPSRSYSKDGLRTRGQRLRNKRK